MEYLKKAPPPSGVDRLQIQKIVSEILADIERDGTDAIRRYSAKFDGWDPPSFRVSPAQIREAEDRVDSKLRAQIEFSRLQVERFARLQRASLVDFQVETLPGVTLGQKQIPVNAVGSYVPGGELPSDRVGLDDDRRPESRWCTASGRSSASPEGVHDDE